MSKKSFHINGDKFSTLQEFFREIGRVLIPGAADGWIHNLDAFNDVLYRGDHKPEGGFILVWRNSDVSRIKLGYPETILQLERRLLICHPANRPIIRDRILLAKQNEGPTLFDDLVEIIRGHQDIELILD